MIEKLTLVRLAAFAAILGGALRAGASFMPVGETTAAIEAFYLVIDLALLFGLIGIYLGRCERAGPIALAGWLLAMTGLAVITGPDAAAFGVDVYYVGVMVIMAGLTTLSLSLVMRGVRLNGAPWLWIGSLAAAILSGVPAAAQIGLILSGVLFGAGFVAAGTALLRDVRRAREAQIDCA